MTRASGAIIVAGLLAWAAPATLAVAQSAAQPVVGARSDVSSQNRPARRLPRVRIHRDDSTSRLGPNAVRQCEAHYEREFRQSGTVIVPRMTCFWVRG